VTDELYLDLDGPDVRPETLDAQASLALAMALLDALLAVSKYEQTSEDAPFFLTLTEMKGASVHFAFNPVAKVTHGNAGPDAFRLAAKRLPGYLSSRGAIPKLLSRPMDRLRQATRGLPSHVVARARMNGETIILTDVARTPEVSLVTTSETVRALIERAGGQKPRVTLRMPSQKSSFTADIPRALLESNDFHIYRLADVSGIFQRDPMAVGSPIVSGQVTAITMAATVDKVAAFDAWYAAAGRPWKDVADVEEELRRRGRE